MAVARARLLAMANDEMGPPDSPRDDSASLLRIADVRLDKKVMALIDAENDSTNQDYDCLNLLRSVPTPRLEALEHRAKLPENKPDPKSLYLLRDIHWEKERRKRWRHRETLKERTEQSERSGLYKMTVVPTIHVEASRAAVHLSGRHVVGKRSRPLLEELQSWKQSEIAASRARKVAAVAAEKARQASFEEAKQELDAEIEEMKRKAKAGDLSGNGEVPKKKSRKNKRRKQTSLLNVDISEEAAAHEDPALADAEQHNPLDTKESTENDPHHISKAAAKERLRSNAVVIPRTPDDTSLKPWFRYVKGLKTETMRQSGLLRPTEEQLQETLSMSHKLEQDNTSLRARVKQVTKDLNMQTSENKRVTQQATVVREKSSIRIREMDSTIVRISKQLEKSEAKNENDVVQLTKEMEGWKTKLKQKILELTGELVATKRESKMSGNENVSLQNDLQKQQERANTSNKKMEQLERLLKESKSLAASQDVALKKNATTLVAMVEVETTQKEEIKRLNAIIDAKTKELKGAVKKSNLKEKDLNRRIKDLIANNSKQLTSQSKKFEQESHLMRAKVNHVELVLDDADKRAVASDKAVRKQLNTERAERGDRERNHDTQLKIAQERIVELKHLTEISEQERVAVVERSQVVEQELREQICIHAQDMEKKILLAAAHLEQVRREKDEIIDSKERQLRTVRGKLTVIKARINDMNSMQIEQKQADDNELLRLQAWVKTIEQRLSDAENAREKEGETLRKLAKDREVLAEEANTSAKIQVAALARESSKVREELSKAEARLDERNEEMVQLAEAAEIEKSQLVSENDNASERTSELVTSFKEQELAWQRNERALRRKIVQLENEKTDALKLKKMNEVDDELMQAKTLISDLRGDMCALDLKAAEDRNKQKSTRNEFILLQDKYKADIAERNNVISRINRGQEQLEMDAFAATNASQVHQVERKKLQEQLDAVAFELIQFKKAAVQEEETLKGELSLANSSIKTLQIQLENFYKDTGSNRIGK